MGKRISIFCLAMTMLASGLMPAAASNIDNWLQRSIEVADLEDMVQKKNYGYQGEISPITAPKFLQFSGNLVSKTSIRLIASGDGRLVDNLVQYELHQREVSGGLEWVMPRDDYSVRFNGSNKDELFVLHTDKLGDVNGVTLDGKYKTVSDFFSNEGWVEAYFNHFSSIPVYERAVVREGYQFKVGYFHFNGNIQFASAVVRGISRCGEDDCYFADLVGNANIYKHDGVQKMKARGYMLVDVSSGAVKEVVGVLNLNFDFRSKQQDVWLGLFTKIEVTSTNRN